MWTDQGKIEINVPISHGGTDFRKVHVNRKVHKLTKKNQSISILVMIQIMTILYMKLQKSQYMIA